MLTGAINYNLALGHALVFLLAGLALTGMVHAFRNLHGLTITPGRCTSVFAGEVAYFPLHLANDRNTPRLALELRAGEEIQRVSTAIAARDVSDVADPLIRRAAAGSSCREHASPPAILWDSSSPGVICSRRCAA